MCKCRPKLAIGPFNRHFWKDQTTRRPRKRPVLSQRTTRKKLFFFCRESITTTWLQFIFLRIVSGEVYTRRRSKHDDFLLCRAKQVLLGAWRWNSPAIKWQNDRPVMREVDANHSTRMWDIAQLLRADGGRSETEGVREEVRYRDASSRHWWVGLEMSHIDERKQVVRAGEGCLHTRFDARVAD